MAIQSGDARLQGRASCCCVAQLDVGSHGHSLAHKFDNCRLSEPRLHLSLPLVLIGALYNGRLAVLCTVVAMVCVDLFLQEPLYSLANDILANTAILFALHF